MELVLQNISKQFKDKLAVNRITCTLTPGVYGLLGPNGSGKTTFLRILADVMVPSEGSIWIDERSKNELQEQYRELVGYLPQDIGFYKHFTAEKFLWYVSALKGLEKEEAKNRIDELLEFVNLTKERKRKIGRFSGGMKQRLGIAQALLNDPKILILDEPTAGLDPNERIRFKNLLANISKDKIILFSTHIASDIEFIANQILIMKQGELVKRGSMQSILSLAEGKVWHCKVSESELIDLQSRYTVANILREHSELVVRVISEEKPVAEAILQVPNLEDVFLYFFDEHLKRSVK